MVHIRFDCLLILTVYLFKFFHHLLTIMLFQTHKTFFLHIEYKY